jgi:hypothetical protein
MPFDRNLLPDAVNYFEGQSLRLSGPRSSRWKTTVCQFHGGTGSMRINIASGGWCCMSCGEKGGDVLAYHLKLHGMEFVEAAKQLGAWVDDGKPARPHKPTPLSPRAALEVIGFECNLVAVAGANIAHGVTLSTVDLSRVLAAAGRINRLSGAFA